MLVDLPHSETTSDIIGAAVEVHRALGPGLLESIYLRCLERELAERRLRFVAQRLVPVVYKGVALDVTYRVDLIVADAVIVEVKAVDTLLPVHLAQTLTYLALTKCPVGLLINFNVATLVRGVRRLVNPRELNERKGRHNKGRAGEPG